ncbi:amino acid adenylation domain-containing protein [Corallococcus sp. BB11-1]|uniref:non-ribosomal peptide synthetase n=1 Tax=Corallococcus sp. BB11-1 TaxID=2996783 RepID=UPI00226E654B|nr:amino acid adenylation domain-containing protein [Corallococcus sp. BB11-1]MCY1037056.1 amino acid adenylation domain-containing protein [Corallococcus sp. BB11-1]
MTQPTGFRLSPQQARLWTLLTAAPGASSRARAVFALEGTLDVARLERAVRGLVSEHEVLRTTYRHLAGTSAAVQVPGEVPATVLEVLDWSALPEAEQAARLEAPGAESAAAASLDVLKPWRLAVLGQDRHALIVEVPALSADRQTFAVLARELGRALTAPAAADEEPPPQYADVAEVFHQILESDDSADGRRFWKDRDLTGAIGASLPTRRTGTDALGLRIGRQSRALSPDTATALEALALRLGVPLADVVLAGWSRLLARMAGGDDACVSVRVEGRGYEGLDAALGLFERWLPVRASHGASFEALVRDVARSVRETAAWQDDFDASSALPGTSGAPPLRSFAFEDVAWPEPVRAGGLTLSLTHLEAHAERAELTLALVRGQGPLSLELHHDEAAYTSEEATRLLERLETLLASAVATPERALESLSWVGPGELLRLTDFNRTARDHDTQDTLPARFDAVARTRPDAVAVAFEDEQLTFATLDERANRIASHLRSRGVGTETRVAVCLERSVEQLVVLLGVLKAGGTFVPLDPTYPRERLAYVIQQSGAPLVVTRSHLRASLPDGAHAFVCLDQETEALAAASPQAPDVTLSPENAAYVIFTSGSTGRPKGVMIPHRSALNLAATLRDVVYQGRGPGLRVSVNAPLVFDASVKQWLQLLNGHSLHIVPEEVRPDAVRMRAWVQRHAVDVVDCTPSLLGPLLAQGLGRDADFSPALVLVGGEAIDARTWADLAPLTRTRFVNMYGPTECTVNATACPIADSAQPSIGGPLGNVRVHVLDAGLRELPLGVPGELFIGGAGVGRGYEGRPDLTAERFVPDPFSPAPGARLYRTGDVGRYREDGRIDFQGRADFQVKVRGYRIEPGEIEAQLRSHPQVGEAVVVVRGTKEDARLVAYFVPRGGVPADGELAMANLALELRAFLRERVPEFMLPTFFMALPRLPLNRNGKVDRGALPEPVAARPDAASYEAPVTELEQRIAAIWQEALKVDRVGLHSSFFDLGGHSLLMVQVHEKLSVLMGRRLSMVELFQHPTVASLAKYLGQAPENAAQESRQQQARDERAKKQLQAMQQQALLMKARGKR